MRYADPSLCPDCRGDLAAGVPVCPACGLLVRHPIAVELFRSLRRADALLTDLRTASTTFHQDRPVPATTASVPRPSSLGGPLVPPAGPVPAKRATLPAPGASGGLPVYPAPPLPPPPLPSPRPSSAPG